MALSRKTYEATAQILREVRATMVRDLPSGDARWAAHLVLDEVAHELGDYFEGDNDRFDPARFWAAAGVMTDIADGWR